MKISHKHVTHDQETMGVLSSFFVSKALLHTHDFKGRPKCVQSHQNYAHVGSYMLLIYSFNLCP